ncbi:MAG: hypothetical protein H7330_04035, partial [Hymenobacteraceae bacterium]|nr:hypothetical protein [Hymenobacteraceae bacterium]
MLSLLTFLLRDLLRNRTVLACAATLLALTLGLWWLDPARLALNLVNVTLLFVPLNAVIFTITYFHNARDFTKLLIVLPVPRRAAGAGGCRPAGLVGGIRARAAVAGGGRWRASAYAGGHGHRAHVGVRGAGLRGGGVRSRTREGDGLGV